MKEIYVYTVSIDSGRELLEIFSLEKDEINPSYFENKIRFSDFLLKMCLEQNTKTICYSKNAHGFICTLFRVEKRKLLELSREIPFFLDTPCLLDEELEPFHLCLYPVEIPFANLSTA